MQIDFIRTGNKENCIEIKHKEIQDIDDQVS